MQHLRAFSCVVMLVATPALVHADAANEARLRDQLRQTMTELRQMQDQNSELQVKLTGAQNAAPKVVESPKASRAEIEKVRSAMKQEMAQVQTELADARAQVATLLQQLTDTQTRFVAARTAATAVGDVQKQLAEIRPRIESCEKDNRDLVEISAELLQRYHDMGVWEALWASEPLTGLGRLHREKIVEKYRGAIIDATLQTSTSPGAKTTPPGTAPPAGK